MASAPLSQLLYDSYTLLMVETHWDLIPSDTPIHATRWLSGVEATFINSKPIPHKPQ